MTTPNAPFLIVYLIGGRGYTDMVLVSPPDPKTGMHKETHYALKDTGIMETVRLCNTSRTPAQVASQKSAVDSEIISTQPVTLATMQAAIGHITEVFVDATVHKVHSFAKWNQPLDLTVLEKKYPSKPKTVEISTEQKTHTSDEDRSPAQALPGHAAKEDKPEPKKSMVAHSPVSVTKQPHSSHSAATPSSKPASHQPSSPAKKAPLVMPVPAGKDFLYREDPWIYPIAWVVNDQHDVKVAYDSRAELGWFWAGKYECTLGFSGIYTDDQTKMLTAMLQQQAKKEGLAISRITHFYEPEATYTGREGVMGRVNLRFHTSCNSWDEVVKWNAALENIHQYFDTVPQTRAFTPWQQPAGTPAPKKSGREF